MTFELFPLRFEFVSKDSLFFPPGKAGNILRGAMGAIFRRIACIPDCRSPRSCEISQSCPYARVFEPMDPRYPTGPASKPNPRLPSASTKDTPLPSASSSQDMRLSGASRLDMRLSAASDRDALDSPGAAPSPSGLADWPRPFVFRARHLDGRAINPGDPFHFDLHVFTAEPEVLAYFILTFSALAREGLGPRRGKAELRRVRCLSADGAPGDTIYEQSVQMITAGIKPLSLDLTPPPHSPTRIRVDFLSPTELKHDHKVVSRPEFPVLFGRVRDRISTLRRLYGPGALDIDYQGTSARAAAIRMTSCHLRRQETERRSTRTGQAHSIGGFIGSAEYEGDVAEFLPYLEAARWTGVGRQSVWGKGEIKTEPSE